GEVSARRAASDRGKLLRSEAPQVGVAVASRCHQPSPSWTEERRHSTAETLQQQPVCAGAAGQIPHLDDAVLLRRRELPAVGAENRGLDGCGSLKADRI